MTRLIIACSLLFLAADRSDAAPALELYAAPPNVDLVTLSPSGRLMASRRTSDEADVIVVYDLDAGEMVSGVDISDVDPVKLSFLGESHLVISALETSALLTVNVYNRQRATFVLDLEKGKFRRLLDSVWISGWDHAGTGHTVAVIPDTASLLLRAYNRRNSSLSLFQVWAGRTRSLVVRQGNRDTIDWFADTENNRFVRVDADEADNSLTMWLIDNGSIELLFEEDRNAKSIEPVGLAPDRDAVMVKAFSPQGRLALYSIPFDGGEIEGPFFAKSDRDVGRVLTDGNRVVVGVEFTGFYPSYEFFDEALTSRIASLQAMSPRSAVTFKSHDEDFSDVILHVSGDYIPGAWMLARKNATSPELIAVERPTLSSDSVISTSILEYQARDGLELSALLTAAVDVRKVGDAPLIVLLNAGPEPHDRIGYHWIAQYFARRGYAVLLPQTRGTFGLGRDRWLAGHGRNNAHRSYDLQDTVQHAFDLGLADPERICIVGIGYGGYAALAASFYSAELYRCVVSINGMSDPSLMPTFRRFYSLRRKDLYYEWGLPGKLRYDRASMGDAALNENADQMKSPVLLIHVEKDSVIPAEQSRVMHEALIRHQKSSQFVELKGHDHWLTDFDTRRSVLETTARFIEEHIGSVTE